jgi:branched-chain amino acid transport system ATP-binding protein
MNISRTHGKSTAAISPDGTGAAMYAQDLRVGYGAVPVLHGVTVALHPGEVVAVLGPNGAGKSTLLTTLAGTLAPSGGDVWFAGRPAASGLAARSRQGLAFVPEGRSVFPSLSVRDNLKLGRGTVEQALEVIPALGPLLSRRAGLLSGGEQQYLALARAIAGRPSVLLADELSLGLAPLIVRSLLRSVRSAADNGAAVLLVEQHLRQAIGVADRIYVLSRGRVVLHGTRAEISDRIQDVEAAYLSSTTDELADGGK